MQIRPNPAGSCAKRRCIDLRRAVHAGRIREQAGLGHSTYVEAARAAKDANVKKLILFHHDPGHDDKFMEQIVQRARQHFENTEAAAQAE